MEYIDISDLDIRLLLEMLWKCTITASFYRYSNIEPPKYEEPDKYYKYIDYHCGRPIKIDFTDMTKIYYKGYDRDAGDGTFLKIVSIIRKNLYTLEK
jgi:hypothetical protein